MRRSMHQFPDDGVPQRRLVMTSCLQRAWRHADGEVQHIVFVPRESEARCLDSHARTANAIWCCVKFVLVCVWVCTNVFSLVVQGHTRKWEGPHRREVQRESEELNGTKRMPSSHRFSAKEKGILQSPAQKGKCSGLPVPFSCWCAGQCC